MPGIGTSALPTAQKPLASAQPCLSLVRGNFKLLGPRVEIGPMALTAPAQGLATQAAGDGTACGRGDRQLCVHSAAAGGVWAEGDAARFREGDGIGRRIVRDVQLRGDRKIRIPIDGLIRN